MRLSLPRATLQLLATVPGLRKMVSEAEDVSAKTVAPVDDSAAPASAAYDGKKREPLFANAQNSCLWELVSDPASAECTRS